MGGLPEALFIVDVENEKIAVAEAKKMGIPIVGLVATNSAPDSVDYIITGNFSLGITGEKWKPWINQENILFFRAFLP